MTATTSKLYDKCKRASAQYARAQVQERRAAFECLPALSRAHLDGTMEGFDLCLSMLVRLRTEMKEADKSDNRQMAFPIAEGETV